MKHQDLGERLNAAKNAKQAMADKFRQRPGHDDPAVAERRAARASVSAARDARAAEREAKRLADDARMAAEREARAAEQAEQNARMATEKAADDARLELERKAARDARYAARKARK
jgi:hypothetical protein